MLMMMMRKHAKKRVPKKAYKLEKKIEYTTFPFTSIENFIKNHHKKNS
jgi:hypothetical protein